MRIAIIAFWAAGEMFNLTLRWAKAFTELAGHDVRLLTTRTTKTRHCPWLAFWVMRGVLHGKWLKVPEMTRELLEKRQFAHPSQA